ncbi:winged helix-turn-helix transcriptional regulator [Candidatus Woesearchaeota archaeon]|nr:winged helix-turn-helix transcriptional regulator [Candidatus Woesearchaeota archaeon]
MADKLDIRNTERLALKYLEMDARMSFSTIGKKLKKSQQQISYTVNSMVRKGILQKFYTVMDYSKFGAISFRVYFRVNYIDEKRFLEFIKHLAKDSHVSRISACGGRYDLLCNFLTYNPSKFNKNLRAIIEKFSEQVHDYLILTNIVTREYGRKYLMKEILPEHIVGGDRYPENIDDADMQILSQISEDARKSSVDIASSLSVNPKTVINRIKKLKQKKVIRCFRPQINPEKAGMASYMLMLKYHNISAKEEKELVNFLRIHKNILRLTKTIGKWDMEIEIEVKNPMELRKVEMQMRQKFSSIIQNISAIPVYYTYKYSYFPEFILEDQNR